MADEWGNRATTYTAHLECATQLDLLLRAIEEEDWRSAAIHADLLRGYAAGAVQQSFERGRAAARSGPGVTGGA